MALAAAPGCGFNSSSAKPGTDAGPGDDAPGGGGDAGPVPDAPPTGNGVCYGPSGWQVCLDSKATGSVQLMGALDTDKSDANNPCLKNQPSGWTASQPAACIVVGDTITVTSLSVTGSRPLVLVAQTRIDVTGLLDAASHRSQNVVGAGAASSADCKPFGSAPGMGPPGGAGAGGGFMFAGGDGGPGNGAAAMSVPGGQAASALVAPTRLRGGCAGQPGGGGSANDGGAGGGAVYLVSAGMISVTGKIDVSGAGGKGRDAEHGGGGGGSGGMIVLHAASIMTTQATFLIANGGGGGGGSSAVDLSQMTATGADGHEPLGASIAPAPGGDGGVGTMGFNGGAGGSGYPAFTNMNPLLKGEAGDIGSGGGGGGGGGGYIRSSQALGMAAVSPAADVKP